MIYHGRIGANVVESFKPQSHFEISGPKVNSEFYPGWLDMWGEPHSRVDKTSVARTLDEMLAINASVNIYVFHGGTSFGFKSGMFHSTFNYRNNCLFASMKSRRIAIQHVHAMHYFL